MICNIPAEKHEGILADVPVFTQEQEWAIAHSFTQYLFYEPLNEQDPYELGYGVKGKRFYCTACRTAFGVSNKHEGPEKKLLKLQHKQETICPHCGEKVTALCKGKFRGGSSLQESRPVVVFRNTNQGLYAVAAWAFTSFESPYGYGVNEEPTLVINKQAIYFFRANERVMFKNQGGYWFCGGYIPPKFEARKNVVEPFAARGAQGWSPGYDGRYYIFGTDELGDSCLKYNGFADYEGMPSLYDGMNVGRMMTYLGEYSGRPALEMVSRLEMRDIVYDLIYHRKTNGKTINWNAKTVQGFLKLTKQETNEYLRKGGTVEDLAEYQKAKRAGEKTSIGESIEQTQVFGGTEAKKSAGELCRKHGVSLHTLVVYLQKQSTKAKIPTPRLLRLWRDYLEAAKAIGFDLSVETVLMPRMLQDAHDTAVSQRLYLENAEKRNGYIKKRYKKLCRKYEFELNGWRIIVPKDEVEIIAEGKNLQHCVGGYAERHMEGRTTILFLRKVDAPGVSLYTVEVRENSIVQAHGYLNERKDAAGYQVPSPFTACGDFLKTWMDWVKEGSPRTPQGRPIVTHKPQKTTAEKTA